MVADRIFLIGEVEWNEFQDRSYEKRVDGFLEWLKKPLISVVSQKGLIVRQDKGLRIQHIGAL